ncbi:MAG TPA: hypothetical protein VGG51_05045 [Candidatus Cybelea sp.]
MLVDCAPAYNVPAASTSRASPTTIVCPAWITSAFTCIVPVLARIGRKKPHVEIERHHARRVAFENRYRYEP